jgi:hypothetical protein
MPFGKVKYLRRRGKITKKATKRYLGARMSIGRSRLSLNNQLHYHKVCYYNTGSSDAGTLNGSFLRIVSTNTLGYGSNGISFRLVDLPNAGEFVALYDVFKLRKIVFEIYPPFNINSAGNTEVTITGDPAPTPMVLMPGIHSVIDYNEVTVPNPSTDTFPTAINTLVQYATYRYTRGGRSHKRVFSPRYLLTSGSTAVAEDRSKWLSTNTGTDAEPVINGIQHYGLKIITDPVVDLPDATHAIAFPVKVTYYLVFKNTK